MPRHISRVPMAGSAFSSAALRNSLETIWLGCDLPESQRSCTKLFSLKLVTSQDTQWIRPSNRTSQRSTWTITLKILCSISMKVRWELTFLTSFRTSRSRCSMLLLSLDKTTVSFNKHKGKTFRRSNRLLTALITARAAPHSNFRRWDRLLSKMRNTKIGLTPRWLSYLVPASQSRTKSACRTLLFGTTPWLTILTSKAIWVTIGLEILSMKAT